MKNYTQLNIMLHEQKWLRMQELSSLQNTDDPSTMLIRKT